MTRCGARIFACVGCPIGDVTAQEVHTRYPTYVYDTCTTIERRESRVTFAGIFVVTSTDAYRRKGERKGKSNVANTRVLDVRMQASVVDRENGGG